MRDHRFSVTFCSSCGASLDRRYPPFGAGVVSMKIKVLIVLIWVIWALMRAPPWHRGRRLSPGLRPCLARRPSGASKPREARLLGRNRRVATVRPRSLASRGSYDSRHRGTGATEAHFGKRQADQAPLAAADHLVVPGRKRWRADHLRPVLPLRPAEVARRRPHHPLSEAQLGPPVHLSRL